MFCLSCRRSECLDPQIHPSAPRNLKIALITFLVLTILTLTLALSLKEGPLAQGLLATAAPLCFIISVSLACARKHSKKLSEPITTADVCFAIKMGDLATLDRCIQKKWILNESISIDDGSKGNLFHVLADTYSGDDVLCVKSMVVKLLVLGQDINARETGGSQRTPLYIANDKNSSIVAAALYQHGGRELPLRPDDDDSE